MQYQPQDNMNFMVQNNSNQMVIDGQQTNSNFEWLNLMNQDSQQTQHWQQGGVQRRPRANTIATAQVPPNQYQMVSQPIMNQQQQQMLNQQQIINQQQQQIINQQQQQMIGQQPMEIVSQPTLIINQTQPSTQQQILVQQPTQPTQIIVQQPQPVLVQTSPQTPTQQIIVQEAIPVTTPTTPFMIGHQGRQRANTIPGSTAPPYPPQNKIKNTPPAGKIAISSNPSKSIPAATSPIPGMIPMMGFPNKLSRDLFTQSEHLRKLDEELDKVDFDDVTVYELKELLRKRGLPSSGKKAILTERLLDEKRNAETRKRNFLEAEELRKKGQLNMNGLPNQIMDLYGGITALTTQELPIPSPVVASPSSVSLQPIMPMGVNQVKTRQRSYSDSRLTRPHLMEVSNIKTSATPINSSLKNQISFTDVMQTDSPSSAVTPTAPSNIVYANTPNQNQSFAQVQQGNIVYTQQPQQPQNYIQIQNMSTDATWNQNNNMSKYNNNPLII